MVQLFAIILPSSIRKEDQVKQLEQRNFSTPVPYELLGLPETSAGAHPFSLPLLRKEREGWSL